MKNVEGLLNCLLTGTKPHSITSENRMGSLCNYRDDQGYGKARGYKNS